MWWRGGMSESCMWGKGTGEKEGNEKDWEGLFVGKHCFEVVNW